MPVARIYTRFPDEATGLAERLRARGYTIELVDPGDFRVTPADIEIQLDRLKTGEAMAAAARFARTHDAEVFVAPGVALDEPALRAAKEGAAELGNAFVDGLKRLLAPFRRAGASAHATRAARRQAKLDAELARETERKRLAEQQAAAKAQQDAKWASEREIVLARQREEDARRGEEQRQRREEEARVAAEREAIVAEERRRAEEIRQREEEERRQHAEAAARLAAEQAARVAEQQRLAEEERKAEEERERKRQAAEAAAQAEAKKRGDLAARVAVAAPAAAAATATARPQPMIARLQQQRERQNARVMWRAMIAAAIVAGVLALGWGAYENRTPAQPLSNSDLVHGQQIKQEVPFGPASIGAQQQQPPATTTATVRPPQTQAQAKPAQAAPAKASPAQGGKPAPRRHARQFKSSPDDVDEVAQDEVIYHGAPKHSSGQASAQQPQSQVKRYSDMTGDGPQ